MATEKDGATIINATIAVCDEEAQQELLVAVNDPALQKDFVKEVDTATDMEIDFNHKHTVLLKHYNLTLLHAIKLFFKSSNPILCIIS